MTTDASAPLINPKTMCPITQKPCYIEDNIECGFQHFELSCMFADIPDVLDRMVKTFSYIGQGLERIAKALEDNRNKPSF